MSQSRTHSIIESVVGVAIGFAIAICSQLVIFPMYGIQIPISANLQMGGWFTLISIIRSYAIRRFFNHIALKRYNND